MTVLYIQSNIQKASFSLLYNMIFWNWIKREESVLASWPYCLSACLFYYVSLSAHSSLCACKQANILTSEKKRRAVCICCVLRASYHRIALTKFSITIHQPSWTKIGPKQRKKRDSKRDNTGYMYQKHEKEERIRFSYFTTPPYIPPPSNTNRTEKE